MASLPVLHEPVHHHAPQPYKFGYDMKEKHGEQYRDETGDSHSGLKGTYGFTDARGVNRQVNYVADPGGFRAQVKANEAAAANQNPAAVVMVSNAPYAGGVPLGYGGYAGLGYGGYGAGYGGYGVGYGGYGAGYGGYGAAAYGTPGYGGYAGQNAGYGNLGYGAYGLGYGNLGGLGYTRYGY